MKIKCKTALLLSTSLTLLLASATGFSATVIDVLAVYTQGTAAAYGGDPTSRINQLFQITNQIYKDSGVDLEIRLAGTQQVDYTDDNTAEIALDAITDGTTVFSGIAAKRVAVGADMVILYRPFKQVQGSCGLGWIGGDFSNPLYKTKMYTHVAINVCPDFVTAHELGHNMGLAHSRRQDGTGGSYPYGLGHGIDNQFVTVMAYATSFGNPATIYKFSNPSLMCVGQPCGVDRTNSATGADAHYAINLTGPIIANFYPPAAPPPVSIDARVNALKDAITSSTAAIAQNKLNIAALAKDEAAKKSALTSATAALKKATSALASANAKYTAATKAFDTAQTKAGAALTALNASTAKTRAAKQAAYDTALAAIETKRAASLEAFSAIASAQAALDAATNAVTPLTTAYTSAQQATLAEKALTPSLVAALAANKAAYSAAVIEQKAAIAKAKADEKLANKK